MKLRRVKRFAAFTLVAALMITGSLSSGITARADSCGGLEQEDLYTPGGEDVIKDPALHWAVRSTLNAIKDRPVLTKELVGSNQVRNISYALCAHEEDFKDWTAQYWIKSLEGLQYATSANMIEICYSSEGRKDNNENRIESLSPLSGLTQLGILILKQDGIADISPLSGLVNLEKLDVSGNTAISDVSAVAGMKKLKILVLAGNEITDVSAVSELETLEYLDIESNKITSLPDMGKLKNMQTFKASGNQLTNDDVQKISAMRRLRMLDIKSNASITDISPLARLIYLEKDQTFLPENMEGEKENLFAAIEVNKLFNKFNISKMQQSDSENVGKALEAYDALNEAQKAYFDSGRIQAARDNKSKVDQGLEPVYYEEYDEDGEAQPVLDRLEIEVVDKNGKPMPGVTFVKKSIGTMDIVTDKNGILTVSHNLNDANWDTSVTLKNPGYVAIPQKFEYEVKDGKTYIVNGKRVTGFEKHQIMLIPENEYVDKTELKEALDSTDAVEEEYKYTSASYKKYSDALKAAQNAYDNADATENDVDTAAANLKNAVSQLQKTDVLTVLKLTVKDVNGNLFTRPFKFQVYETGKKGTDKGSWNQLSDAETGVVYLQASPGWQDGKKWTVDACFEELYNITPVDVVIGVKSDGQRYYKTVGGQSADPDFEGVVTATYHGNITPGYEERKPDNTVLVKRIENAKAYVESNYTEDSFASLQTAIQEAEAAAEKAGASQEDYNKAAAGLSQAEAGLKEQADTVALEKALRKFEESYKKDYFTAATWQKYEEAYNSAKKVYDNKNSTQEQVDNALAMLQDAENTLVRLVDKQELGQELEQAKALNGEDYESGYDELQTAISEAQAVYDNNNASQTEVDGALDKLQEAVKGLKKKTPVIDYCDPGIFRALVKDEQGNPLSGVSFKVQFEGVSKAETVKTDQNGIFEYYIPDKIYNGKKAVVSLADKRYATTEEHSFIADGIFACMVSLDGQKMVIEDYGDQTVKLTYTLTPTGVENPDPVDPDNPDNPDPVDPDPGNTDKKALKEQIDFADSIKHKKSEYTEESFSAMLEALAEAEAVYADEEATPEMVAASTQKLKNARESLKTVEKRLTDKSNIRILLKDSAGKLITETVDFYMMLGNNTPILQSFRNGILEYGMTDADQGVNTVTVFVPEEGIMIDGETYQSSPESHEFDIESSSLGVFVTQVDGKPLDAAGQEVVFILEKDSSVEPEQWSAECFTYDGNVLTGLSKAGKVYLAKNPNVVIPEKSISDETVTEIAAEAFKNSNVESVELPASLVKIGDSAFMGNNLSSVKLPDTITDIAKNAFAYNAGTVVLEVGSKDVLKYVKRAGLEGISIKDNTPEDNPEPEEPIPEKPQQPAAQNYKVTKISITGMSQKIAAGKKIALAAKIMPVNASNKNVTWKSSNTKVATVSASGVVTMKKKTGGKKVTITATAADGSGVSGSYKITSMKNPVKKVSISGSKTVKAGKSVKLKAKVQASKGANKKVIWASSNKKYATVSASGKVKTYKAGKGKKVKITAKATDGSNKKKTVTIKIK